MEKHRYWFNCTWGATVWTILKGIDEYYTILGVACTVYWKESYHSARISLSLSLFKIDATLSDKVDQSVFVHISFQLNIARRLKRDIFLYNKGHRHHFIHSVKSMGNVYPISLWAFIVIAWVVAVEHSLALHLANETLGGNSTRTNAASQSSGGDWREANMAPYIIRWHWLLKACVTNCIEGYFEIPKPIHVKGKRMHITRELIEFTGNFPSAQDYVKLRVIVLDRPCDSVPSPTGMM